MCREWVEVGGLALKDQDIVATGIDKDNEVMRGSHHGCGGRIATEPREDLLRDGGVRWRSPSSIGTAVVHDSVGAQVQS